MFRVDPPSPFGTKGKHQKNKLFFFSEKLRKGGGGVWPNPKFPYQKKLRFFGNFFFQKGGGAPLFQKGVIMKTGDFWIFSSKGGVSPNPKFQLSETVCFFGNGGGGSFPIQNFLIRKNWDFFGFFFQKGGGSHIIQRTGDSWIFLPKGGFSPNP